MNAVEYNRFKFGCLKVKLELHEAVGEVDTKLVSVFHVIVDINRCNGWLSSTVFD